LSHGAGRAAQRMHAAFAAQMDRRDAAAGPVVRLRAACALVVKPASGIRLALAERPPGHRANDAGHALRGGARLPEAGVLPCALVAHHDHLPRGDASWELSRFGQRLTRAARPGPEE